MEMKWYWWVGGALLVVLLFAFFFSLVLNTGGLSQKALSVGDMSESAAYNAVAPGFAPDVTDRLITRDARLDTTVSRGAVPSAMDATRAIATRYDAIVLSEQFTENDVRSSVRYELKVPAQHYEGLIVDLKGLGEVQSLLEDAEDITGRFQDLELELAAERERLSRLKALSAEKSRLSEELEVEEHIFNQERKILYLEKQLVESDARVDYSTVYLTIREKESSWAAMEFVSLADLASTLVGSVKILLYFIAAMLPWAVLAWLIVLGVRFVKRR